MKLPMTLPVTFDGQKRLRLAIGLALASVVIAAAGMAAGGEGWSLAGLVRALGTAEGRLIVFEIRAPRTLGAWLAGALLGLSGAAAQGLFRNPLADPYLLGSASGAVLGVVLVLAAAALGGHVVSVATAGAIARFGLVGAAFAARSWACCSRCRSRTAHKRRCICCWRAWWWACC